MAIQDFSLGRNKGKIYQRIREGSEADRKDMAYLILSRIGFSLTRSLGKVAQKIHDYLIALLFRLL